MNESMHQNFKKYFPALKKDWIYLDGPGGTQVSKKALQAISQRLQKGVSNFHGSFPLSEEMDLLSDTCRHHCSKFLGASNPNEIHFGPNMTTLSFQLAQTLSKEWSKGDNIILTHLDHYANVSPYLLEAEKKNVHVRWLSFTPDHPFLKPEDLLKVIDSKTKFIALPAATNTLGSINPIKKLCAIAHRNNTLVHVDAVHLAPHAPINVKQLQADILTCSAYKFYCPHLGIQWMSEDLREKLSPHKVKPAPNSGPMRFETGTQNQASMAGVIAGLEFLSSLSGETSISILNFKRALTEIKHHEETLSIRFITGIQSLKQWNLHGTFKTKQRTPTFSLTHQRLSSPECSTLLSQHKISSWAGHFYAVDTVRVLGVEKQEGFLRLGFSAYHSVEDVDRVIKVLARIL